MKLRALALAPYLLGSACLLVAAGCGSAGGEAQRSQAQALNPASTTSDEDLCGDSGGKWLDDDPGPDGRYCTCAILTSWVDGIGCVQSDETLCDGTGGKWLDDEPGPDGRFCACPAGVPWFDHRGCAGSDEELCIDTGGHWLDDTPGPDGLYCACATGKAWAISKGCQ